MTDIIEMYHAYKIYSGDQEALKDVSIKVKKGEFVFLTGPSGAGKTTLLKLLLCAERPTKGQILVNGQNITRLRNPKIAFYRRKIGFVFQDFKLLEDYTVFDNVALALWATMPSPADIKKRVNFYLRMVGLEHKARLKPLKLSGGEQQRVAIARALVNDPLILLADEPTGNLDPDLTLDIMNLFSMINARGTTVMVATHDPSLVRSSHRKVFALDRGCIVKWIR